MAVKQSMAIPMKTIPLLFTLLLAMVLPVLASAVSSPTPDARGNVARAADTYIVASRETFAGVSAIAREASPVTSRAGTALILARTDADGVDALARYVHQQEGRCGGFFAFASRAEAEAFLANDRTVEAITRPMSGIYTIDNQATVDAWLPQVQEGNIYDTIAALSGLTPPHFPNRYYASPHGRAAAEWIRDTWSALAARHARVHVALHENCTSCSTQPSVILSIQGSDLADEVVVVGAHLDSINGNGSGGDNQVAPGADDDASGVATVTEIIRVALASGWKPRRTIEFHAYAAEETGLNGSKAIATQYQNEGVNVVGMLQLDMTNYRTTAVYEVRIVTDYSNSALQFYFQQLFDTYLAPMGMTRSSLSCGYACSDHASWTNRGFPAGMLFEAGEELQYPGDWADFPYIHTANDTLANMGDSAQHSVPFAQFGLAFIGELGKTTVVLGPAIFEDGFEPAAGQP